MTITVTDEEWDELWGEPIHTNELNSESRLSQVLWETPQQIGRGYWQTTEIYPELILTLTDLEYRDDLLITSPVSEHTLHFDVLLSGKVVNERGQVGEGYTLICGGGIQDKIITEIKKFQRLLQVSILMPHHLLATFFPGKNGETIPELRQFVKDNDWQTVLLPKSTPAIHGVAQQMINCPFHGATKRIYLQGKNIRIDGATVSSNFGERG